ncbi:accessory factor UbiK family protein [Holosporaceae bacterium 'Namur']|nr:accessory factor UbiK family protein [Holosporaceae bacterium 'Namur']
MKKDNKFFEDFSKLASSAFASAATMRRELSDYMRQYVESFVKKMDFVTKDELEVVKKIALQTDKELQQLKKKYMNIEETKSPKKQEKSKVVNQKPKSSSAKKVVDS